MQHAVRYCLPFFRLHVNFCLVIISVFPGSGAVFCYCSVSPLLFALSTVTVDGGEAVSFSALCLFVSFLFPPFLGGGAPLTPLHPTGLSCPTAVCGCTAPAVRAPGHVLASEGRGGVSWSPARGCRGRRRPSGDRPRRGRGVQPAGGLRPASGLRGGDRHGGSAWLRPRTASAGLAGVPWRAGAQGAAECCASPSGAHLSLCSGADRDGAAGHRGALPGPACGAHAGGLRPEPALRAHGVHDRAGGGRRGAGHGHPRAPTADSAALSP